VGQIIDIDLQRRRISLSIKQAAEGGEVAAEYREHFGEHAYDPEGNYIGPAYDTQFVPESEAQAAWAEYLEEAGGAGAPTAEGEADALSPALEGSASGDAGSAPAEQSGSAG
jgi:small subunit ribosomal protein S1